MTLVFENTPRPRIRDLGYAPGNFIPGPANSITDVPGVTVGQVTLHDDSKGIHTGVTIILPRGKETTDIPCYAGTHDLNGRGELTGAHVVNEWGYVNTPIAFTNSVSVGKVYDALTRWQIAKERKKYGDDENGDLIASRKLGIPLVGETYDGMLNDLLLSAVEREHVEEAIKLAESGTEEVKEGGYGGGTAMICHRYKGGTGTSSRIIPGFDSDGKKKDYTLGVIVQSNHGQEPDLRIGNVPIGKLLMKEEQKEGCESATFKDGTPLPVGGKAAEGSILVLIITDAPLLPHQLRRLAQHAGVGISQVGGHAAGRNPSGEILLALSTGTSPDRLAEQSNGRGYLPPVETQRVETLVDETIDSIFYAVSETTEEAILNSMCKGEALEGFRGRKIDAFPVDRVKELLEKYMISV
ncbi:Beta-peptidyl aminopeptidase BapA [Lachnellula suecica]|uniref:Beta-peptidyl aminopeptidase BapA n=1 Tax=Lachnellula suecica TaxID=602035 RepID=A0A8T9CJH6_9HELO|nr:Beta-peptidyl aminopeptidase BapA [Lachnellula suecica]